MRTYRLYAASLEAVVVQLLYPQLYKKLFLLLLMPMMLQPFQIKLFLWRRERSKQVINKQQESVLTLFTEKQMKNTSFAMPGSELKTCLPTKFKL